MRFMPSVQKNSDHRLDDRCDYRWMVSPYHKDSITNPEKILQIKMLNYMKQKD